MTPFKVVCIDENWTGAYSRIAPKKGQICTVIKLVESDNHNRSPFYILSEFPQDAGFTHQSFAPIQTNYADATAEILEKFPIVNDTPDKVIKEIPVKTN